MTESGGDSVMVDQDVLAGPRHLAPIREPGVEPRDLAIADEAGRVGRPQNFQGRGSRRPDGRVQIRPGSEV
jgi:hypothetical protein